MLLFYISLSCHLSHVTSLSTCCLFYIAPHWGWGGLKPVITCWEHWELWLNEPRDFMVMVYRTHLKCTHDMCSIWDWWEHFWGIWIVTSTCASYVTTHNSWQPLEICPTIFSKCSHWAHSKNILKILLGKFQMVANCYGWLHMRHMLKLQSKHRKNVLTNPRSNTCCGYISNVSYMPSPWNLWAHSTKALNVLNM